VHVATLASCPATVYIHVRTYLYMYVFASFQARIMCMLPRVASGICMYVCTYVRTYLCVYYVCMYVCCDRAPSK
jgi:hypothetical protein